MGHRKLLVSGIIAGILVIGSGITALVLIRRRRVKKNG